MFSIDYQTKILISKELNVDLLDVVLGKYILTQKQKTSIEEKIEFLKNGTPLDYLLEEINIIGLKLKLTKDTLIPREETEEWICKYKDLVILEKNLDLVVDLGTGSGVIGLFLAEIYKKVILIDISSKTMQIAKQNANLNKIENVEFLLCDGLSTEFTKKLSEYKSTKCALPTRIRYDKCKAK